MKRGKVVILIFFAMFLGLSLSPHLNAQVSIGSIDPPQVFSILEIVSNNTRSLRLSQLTASQQNDLTKSSEFDNMKTTLARGLVIYNMDTNETIKLFTNSGDITPTSYQWVVDNNQVEPINDLEADQATLSPNYM